MTPPSTQSASEASDPYFEDMTQKIMSQYHVRHPESDVSDIEDGVLEQGESRQAPELPSGHSTTCQSPTDVSKASTIPLDPEQAEVAQILNEEYRRLGSFSQGETARYTAPTMRQEPPYPVDFPQGPYDNLENVDPVHARSYLGADSQPQDDMAYSVFDVFAAGPAINGTQPPQADTETDYDYTETDVSVTSTEFDLTANAPYDPLLRVRNAGQSGGTSTSTVQQTNPQVVIPPSIYSEVTDFSTLDSSSFDDETSSSGYAPFGGARGMDLLNTPFHPGDVDRSRPQRYRPVTLSLATEDPRTGAMRTVQFSGTVSAQLEAELRSLVARAQMDEED